MSSQATSGQWACRKCTFDNSNKSRKCQLCQSPRRNMPQYNSHHVDSKHTKRVQSQHEGQRNILSMYEQLINRGFDDGMSMIAAEQHPYNFTKSC